MVREENGEKQAVWIKLNGKDHFFHAMAYLASAVAYQNVLEENKEHQNLNTEISGVEGFSSPIITGGSQDIFGSSALIGYSNGGFINPINGRDKIVRRHS